MKALMARAITHLQKFLDLWKNADPDLQPKIAEARARIARLMRQEKR